MKRSSAGGGSPLPFAAFLEASQTRPNRIRPNLLPFFCKKHCGAHGKNRYAGTL
jgi:hypothetical protein